MALRLVLARHLPTPLLAQRGDDASAHRASFQSQTYSKDEISASPARRNFHLARTELTVSMIFCYLALLRDAVNVCRVGLE